MPPIYQEGGDAKYCRHLNALQRKLRKFAKKKKNWSTIFPLKTSSRYVLDLAK